MGLRVGFVGAHGTGKTQLVEFSANVLGMGQMFQGQRSAYAMWLPSAQRVVAELTGLPTDGSSDWLTLWSAIQRRLWEFEEDSKSKIILSDRTGLDNVAYEMRLTFQRRQEFERHVAGAKILSPDGNEVVLGQEGAEKMGMMNLSQSITTVLIHMAEAEIRDFWDFVYFVRPLESVALVDDGVRPDVVSQKEVDAHLNLLINGAPGVPVLDVLASKVVELPRQLDEAKEFLKETELPKWKEKLNEANH